MVYHWIPLPIPLGKMCFLPHGFSLYLILWSWGLIWLQTGFCKLIMFGVLTCTELPGPEISCLTLTWWNPQSQLFQTRFSSLLLLSPSPFWCSDRTDFHAEFTSPFYSSSLSSSALELRAVKFLTRGLSSVVRRPLLRGGRWEWKEESRARWVKLAWRSHTNRINKDVME